MSTPARTLTIIVDNASDTEIVVDFGQLQNGDWENGAEPVPGSVISAGQQTFVTGADNPFEELVGTIQLTPANGGGPIVISWTWASGSEVTDTVTTTAALNGLTVTSNLINMETMNPQLQVYITDSGASLQPTGTAITPQSGQQSQN